MRALWDTARKAALEKATKTAPEEGSVRRDDINPLKRARIEEGLGQNPFSMSNTKVRARHIQVTQTYTNGDATTSQSGGETTIPVNLQASVIDMIQKFEQRVVPLMKQLGADIKACHQQVSDMLSHG